MLTGCHRQAPLGAAVQGGDERRQFGFLYVLQLVDEHDQRGAGLRGGGAHCLEQGLQVVLQVAVVGQARLGVEVQADLDVLVLDLQRPHEAGQRAQGALGKVARLLVAAQAQQGLAQLRRQQRRQGAALGRLDADRMHVGALGFVAHPVEKHGLADAAQAHHQHALGRQSATRPLDRDPHRFEQRVAPGQLGRRRAGARGVGVEDRVHRREFILKLASLQNSCKPA